MFEELVKVGAKVVLHALFEEVGQPESIRVVHQTIVVHSHHLCMCMYVYVRKNRFMHVLTYSAAMYCLMRRQRRSLISTICSIKETYNLRPIPRRILVFFLVNV